jgi:hypothetical protein
MISTAALISPLRTEVNGAYTLDASHYRQDGIFQLSWPIDRDKSSTLVKYIITFGRQPPDVRPEHFLYAKPASSVGTGSPCLTYLVCRNVLFGIRYLF